MLDYLKTYKSDDATYIKWYQNQSNYGRKEILFIILYVFTLISIPGLFIFLFWAAKPAEYKPYRCEDRGGIKQALTNRSGYAMSYICEDGTQQPTRTMTRDSHWAWND